MVKVKNVVGEVSKVINADRKIMNIQLDESLLHSIKSMVKWEQSEMSLVKSVKPSLLTEKSLIANWKHHSFTQLCHW